MYILPPGGDWTLYWMASYYSVHFVTDFFAEDLSELVVYV